MPAVTVRRRPITRICISTRWTARWPVIRLAPGPEARIFAQRERFGRPVPHVRAGAGPTCSSRGSTRCSTTSSRSRKVGEDDQGNVIKERRNAAGATVAGIGAEAKAGIPGRIRVPAGLHLPAQPLRRTRDGGRTRSTPQRRMFRSPDHYGYLTAVCTLTRSVSRRRSSATITGRMLVQHNAGFIAKDTERLTPDFWGHGVRACRIPCRLPDS